MGNGAKWQKKSLISAMNKKWNFRKKIEILTRDLSSYAVLNEFDTDKYEAKEKLCVLELDLES